jgi:hypothetical protein
MVVPAQAAGHSVVIPAKAGIQCLRATRVATALADPLPIRYN